MVVPFKITNKLESRLHCIYINDDSLYIITNKGTNQLYLISKLSDQLNFVSNQ